MTIFSAGFRLGLVSLAALGIGACMKSESAKPAPAMAVAKPAAAPEAPKPPAAPAFNKSASEGT